MTEFFLPLAFFRPSFTGFNKIIKVFSISIGKSLQIQITLLWILMDMYPDLLMLTFLSNYFVLYLIKRKSVTFYLNFFQIFWCWLLSATSSCCTWSKGSQMERVKLEFKLWEQCICRYLSIYIFLHHPRFSIPFTIIHNHQEREAFVCNNPPPIVVSGIGSRQIRVWSAEWF